MTRNLTLPGNPRYQPKELVEFFGYDNLAKGYVEVEIATLRMLATCGIIPRNEIARLTPRVEKRLLAITTSQVDERERKETKHDIRALVKIMQDIVGLPLARWIHVPLTSYDVIDTARSLTFLQAYQKATKPAVHKLVGILRDLSLEYIDTRQIGRSHGQAALPITVGFWIATILARVVSSAHKLDEAAEELVGKIAGPVGAGNAIKALGIKLRADDDFEACVLQQLYLRPPAICTQIVPPEPLANFLFQYLMVSAALAQLGRDCRHLMRSEIGEIEEEFEEGQVGSSTMAHKRNPINFENLEGMYIRSTSEFTKVLQTMISEHQRDLTGSAPARDFPIIVVNLHNQLNTLLRQNQSGVPFLSRIRVNKEALQKNFSASAGVILAEPLYLALQMAGYEGDAHHLVNHRVVPLATGGKTIVDALEEITDEEVRGAWSRVPSGVKHLLTSPEEYTGFAEEKVELVAELASRYLGFSYT